MPAALSLVVCAAPLADRIADVAAAFVAAGWDVAVVVTPMARSWVDHAAVKKVTGSTAVSDFRQPGDPPRGPEPAVTVVCPLTFNTLNKLAAGISDNYALGLLNEAIAGGTPVLAVPLISDRLWSHPALAGSLDRLGSAGVTFLDAETGDRGARPVRSGSGSEVAAAFDPAWLLSSVADLRLT